MSVTILPDVVNDQNGNSLARYSGVAIVLHWAIAVLIIVNIPLGIVGAQLENDFGQQLTNLHKPLGIAVLAFSFLRILWRLGHRPPSLPEAMPGAMRCASHVVHILLYAGMIMLPLTGWWMTSAFPKRHPIMLLGDWTIPFLPVPMDMEAAIFAHDAHQIGGYLMLALVFLHIVAALRHHLILKDGVLRRMLPFC